MHCLLIILLFFLFLTAFDMKKDIDVLIAEERAEIIAKYEKVKAFAFAH